LIYQTLHPHVLLLCQNQFQNHHHQSLSLKDKIQLIIWKKMIVMYAIIMMVNRFVKLKSKKNEIMKMKKKKKDEINKEHFCCFASEDSNNICETRYVSARDVFFSI